MKLLNSLILLSTSLSHPSLAHPPSHHLCATLPSPLISNARILTISSASKPATLIPPSPPITFSPISVPSICEVNITLTHPGLNDTATIQIWLPLQNWNGRFLAVGGSAWVAGHFGLTQGPAVAAGFAAASTDAGVPTNPFSPPSWALDEAGELNVGLLTNFASRSVYDLAIAGKAITESFYKRKPVAYWNGCSTGGRQGLVAAQQYPEVFDGILAGAPAIYWPEYVVAELWPQVVMKDAGVFPPVEELDAVVAAAVAFCDELDGVRDGIVTEPNVCAGSFDARAVIGQSYNISGKEGKIGAGAVDVVRKIWQGPNIDGQQLWYGAPIGAAMDILANTTVSNHGKRTGLPFFVPDTWVKWFVQKDPTYAVSDIDSKALKKLFLKSQSFDDLLNNANPDLSRLQRSGTKLLVWHGGADQIIYSQGTTQYRQRVEGAMGGVDHVDEYFRYFIAPGVNHCGVGTTPAPVNALESLIKWVEKGVPPSTLTGQTSSSAPVQLTRLICKYPLVPKYRQTGDTNSLASYECVKGSPP
ncbi:tannase and feruloyl esterase [Amniculicola lignicola CBS 123094]|uniref:Carboxylic ester hydrolase n=1 Tax=Amniculicola lignicola CBS 123094 TaxID=1392246 RepID=A0A6A5X0Q7_9PLEO|nr:tannase and feruloyl esterase [Amniculicola lignicola CBS 123094]